MGASSIAKGGAAMPRKVRNAAASLLAVATLGAAAASLALAAPAGSDVRALLDSLMVLRDGYGARHVPQPDEPRRNP